MSNSLLDIINDILDFSKIESGKFVFTPVHYNIALLFNNICSMSSFIASGKELQFRSSRSSYIPEILYGDELRVRQILTNVVNNAVKYTRQGFVDFSLKRGARNGGKDYLIAVVEDSGIGIKKEDLPNLFGVFQQFDTHSNRSITGTGLGLAITKNLLDLMGGFIEVASEYGKGSRFTLYIPLVEGDAAQVENKAESPRVIAHEDVSALVVDDMPVNLTVALGFLATHNIKADTALSGAKAIEMIQEKRYDLIFMDHMMPDMDGIETAKRIRGMSGEWFQKTPIVALTANAVSGMAEMFLSSGMNGFISKPIDGERLNAMLAQWLPPEKFAFSENAGSPAALPDDPLFKRIKEKGEVEGVDTIEGLSHTGGVEEYYRILRQFCWGLDKLVALIKTDREKGDWQDYIIRVHGIKGVMRTIGHKELGNWAYTLEEAGRTGDVARCSEETSAFCAALLRFRDILRETGLLTAPPDAEKARIEEGDLRLLLSTLKDACISFDADKIEDLTAKLRNVFLNEEADAAIQNICVSADAFDYEEAIKKIEFFDF
jgi:CheY-like chemotaxis protein/HPt (histidine-containing phosphotransfer) domain-containing protein